MRNDTSDPNPGDHATRPRLNLVVFGISFLVIIGLTAAAIARPRTIHDFFDAAVIWTGRWFGSFYILLLTAILIFLVGLALGRYGNVKLGPDDSTPEFSTFSWTAMLFGAGIGTDIMFFAVAEPAAHYMAPPIADPQTSEAAREAVTWTLFH